MIQKQEFLFLFLCFFFIFTGSPIELNVLTEANQVKVLFEKCKTAQVNELCSFIVETKDSGQGDVKASISSKNNLKEGRGRY